MGFINKLFSRKKSADEISEEERAKLNELLNEKKIAEEEYDDEYIDDITIPEIQTIKKEPIKDTQIKDKENTTPEPVKKNEDLSIISSKDDFQNNSTKDTLKLNENNSIYNSINSLSYEEIAKMKELLNKKEKELEQRDIIANNKKTETKIKIITDAENLKDNKKDNNKKYYDYNIYETTEYGVDALEKINVTKNATFNPKDTPNITKKEEILIIEENDSEKDLDELNGVIINKLRDIFTDENMFFKESKQINYEILKGEEVTCIGIRKKEAYFNWESVSEQSAWFISEIKKFNELKNFKVIRSEEGIKDLVWNKERPIIISFRSVNHLPNQDNFIFPEK